MANPTEEAIKSSKLAATFTLQRSTRHIGDAFFIDDKLKPQMSCPNSARLATALRADSIRREHVVTFHDGFDSDDDEDGDGHTRKPKEERQLSAREAVAAQEAEEAAVMAEKVGHEEEDVVSFGTGGGRVTMSLMDLLEEMDRQMGLQGTTYRIDDDDEDYDDDEEDDEGGEEHDCCVCMVKHKGTDLEPCGHSFCRT